MRRMIGQRTGHETAAGAAHPRSLLALVTGYEFLRRRADARNVDRLRAELGCTLDEARRLYSLAREQGFGAAYESVFGAPPRHGRRRPIPAPKPRGSSALGGLSSPQGHPARQP